MELNQQGFPLLDPFAQNTVAREMCQQEVHLIVQNLASLQIDVLRMGRTERDRQQFHARLFGRSAGLVVIASFTGGDNIYPAVLSTLAQWVDMVS